MASPAPSTATVSANCTSWYDEYVSEYASYQIKFWTVLVCGTSVCVTGILFNGVLLAVMLGREKFHRSYMVYLVALAFLDVGILATYIGIFSTKILYQYLESRAVYDVWVAALGKLFIVSKVVVVAQTYLIVAATVERFCEVNAMRKGVSFGMPQIYRYAVMIGVMLFSVLFKMPVYWELDFIEVKGCLGTFVDIRQSALSAENWYNIYYVVWADCIIRVFVPFVVLLGLNLAIIAMWRRALQPASATQLLVKLSFVSAEQVLSTGGDSVHYFGHQDQQVRLLTGPSTEQELLKEREVRRRILTSATTMMIAIVSCYLICNSAGLVITIWERIDMDYLRGTGFYTIYSDIVSILVALNSTVRLPIYYMCNPAMRTEINACFRRRISTSLTMITQSDDNVVGGDNNNGALSVTSRYYRYSVAAGMTPTSPNGRSGSRSMSGDGGGGTPLDAVASNRRVTMGNGSPGLAPALKLDYKPRQQHLTPSGRSRSRDDAATSWPADKRLSPVTVTVSDGEAAAADKTQKHRETNGRLPKARDQPRDAHTSVRTATQTSLNYIDDDSSYRLHSVASACSSPAEDNLAERKDNATTASEQTQRTNGRLEPESKTSQNNGRPPLGRAATIDGGVPTSPTVSRSPRRNVSIVMWSL